jgi:hypothetical protein
MAPDGKQRGRNDGESVRFHRGGGKDETGTAAHVQIYVKSSALSPDLAISAHLMTEAEIDELWIMPCRQGSSRGYNKEVRGINPYPAIPSRLPSWRNARSRRSCRYARRHAR